MRKIIFISVALAMCGSSFAAAPSDALIKELMSVTESEKMIDVVSVQIDAAMQASMQQALQGKEVTPDAQKAMDNMRVKMVAVMKEELSWARMEPFLITLYQQSFNQAEIEGMLTFYKSEAGRAVIAKMPVVMSHSMQLMQQSVAEMTPKFQKIQEEFIQELKAACKDKCREEKPQ